MAPQGRKTVKAGVLLGRLSDDVRSLNSSVLVITQKMKYVVRNEKILGRNLIVLNKKLKALEGMISSGQIGSAESSSDSGVKERLDEMTLKLAELEARLQQLSDNAASKEELHEMHYVVDSINPLKFVTLEQAKELLKGAGSEKGKRKSRK